MKVRLKKTGRGRPIKIHDLAKTINEIIDTIMKEKKNETINRLALFEKAREHLP